jgi:hypothetical protein
VAIPESHSIRVRGPDPSLLPVVREISLQISGTCQTLQPCWLFLPNNLCKEPHPGQWLIPTHRTWAKICVPWVTLTGSQGGVWPALPWVTTAWSRLILGDQHPKLSIKKCSEVTAQVVNEPGEVWCSRSLSLCCLCKRVRLSVLPYVCAPILRPLLFPSNA